MGNSSAKPNESILSPETRARIESSFRKFGDANVTLSHFRERVPSGGDDAAQRLWRIFDPRKQGSIRLSDFICGLSMFYPGDLPSCVLACSLLFLESHRFSLAPSPSTKVQRSETYLALQSFLPFTPDQGDFIGYNSLTKYMDKVVLKGQSHVTLLDIQKWLSENPKQCENMVKTVWQILAPPLDHDDAQSGGSGRSNPTTIVQVTLLKPSSILVADNLKIQMQRIISNYCRSLHSDPKKSCPLALLFSTAFHGTSLQTFYKHTQDKGRTILLVKVTEGHIFGFISPESWAKSEKDFFGSSDCFLFSLSTSESQTEQIYPSTGANKNFMRCTNTELAIGGKRGQHALFIESDMVTGMSRRTDTFNNPILSGDNPFFKAAVIEVWGFPDHIVQSEEAAAERDANKAVSEFFNPHKKAMDTFVLDTAGITNADYREAAMAGEPTE